MLYTTATALGDTQLANISESHLTNYAAAIQKINHAIADVVMRELAKDDHEVQGDAAPRQDARDRRHRLEVDQRVLAAWMRGSK